MIKNIIAGIAGVLTVFIGVWVYGHFQQPGVGAVAILNTFQGGTGTSSPSGILYGDETIRLKTVTIGNNLTFSGGTLSATAGSALEVLDEGSSLSSAVESIDFEGAGVTATNIGNAITVTIPGGAGGGGSGGGTWSTTTSQVPGQLINYSNNTDDVVVIGASATTSGEFYFDPNKPSWKVSGALQSQLLSSSTATSSLDNGIVINAGCFSVGGTCLLANIVEDTTPQLGGDLDANGNNLTNQGNITFKTGATGGTLRTGTSNADKFILQGYDVDDTTYRDVLEVDAGNTVLLSLPILSSNGFVKTSGGTGLLSIDTNTYLTGNETITLSGDVTGSGATAITTTIASGAVDESMLNLNAPTNNYILVASSSATGGYEWVATSSSNLNLVQPSDLHDAVTLAGTPDYITLSGQQITRNTIDIGDDTNLTVGATGIELAGDDIALTSGYIIPLSASTTNWNDFYDTPSTRITAGTGLSWAGNTLNSSGGGTFSWDVTSYGVSTSTVVGFTGGMLSTASSTFTGASTTITNLVAQGAVQFFTQFWNDLTDFVTYIRSLFTAGTGIDITAGAISFDVTDTNINATSTLSLSAGGGIGTITGGATGPTQVEFNTSDMNFDVLDFSTSVNTCAYWQTTMPDKYTGGAVSATFYWTATSSSGTVTWGIKARSFNNDNPLDTAHSATTSVTDTLIATNDMHVSPATALFTPTGSPAGGSFVNFEVCRDVADTLGTNARLLSVSIQYPIQGLTD